MGFNKNQQDGAWLKSWDQPVPRGLRITGKLAYLRFLDDEAASGS